MGTDRLQFGPVKEQWLQIDIGQELDEEHLMLLVTKNVRDNPLWLAGLFVHELKEIV